MSCHVTSLIGVKLKIFIPSSAPRFSFSWVALLGLVGLVFFFLLSFTHGRTGGGGVGLNDMECVGMYGMI
jgi:hypothetical protein